MQHDLIWVQPVKLGLGGGTQRLICSPADALRSHREWPPGSGWFFERALDSCHAALERQEDLDFSRRAFVAASLEASIPFA